MPPPLKMHPLVAEPPIAVFDWIFAKISVPRFGPTSIAPGWHLTLIPVALKRTVDAM
jgi:hypothetical protein